jgi:hypothetical protein
MVTVNKRYQCSTYMLVERILRGLKKKGNTSFSLTDRNRLLVSGQWLISSHNQMFLVKSYEDGMSTLFCMMTKPDGNACDEV